MTLEEFQKTITEVLKPVQHPRIASLLALTEEVGEVSKEAMNLEIYEVEKNTDKLSDELADVFLSLCELASLYDISLEEAVSKKLEKIRKKVPEWEVKMGDALSKKRKQWD